MGWLSGAEEGGTKGDPTPPAFDIKRIAIIGAGPSGLAAAKHLLAEGFASSQIDIYEQQAEVGGVWNYSAVTSSTSTTQPQVPLQTAPAPDLPIYPEEEEEEEEYELDSDDEACTAPGSGACSLPSMSRKERRPPVFPNPMYDDLHTNIPHTLMQYSDLSFTADAKGDGKEGKWTHEDCEIFPSRQVVQEYLLHYARDVRHLVRFSTQVTNVSLKPLSSSQGSTGENGADTKSQIRGQWTVRSKNLLTDVSRIEVYDAVVVASGHYSTPYIPLATPGLSAFASAHPGVLSHAKTYRTASAFSGKRVVIVGSGPSGLDIASQISAACASPLIISARSPVPDDVRAHLGAGDKVRIVGPIERFLVDEKGIEVRREGGGQAEGGEGKEKTERITAIDAILFCTGYLYTFPFFSASSPSSSSSFPPSTPPLVTDGRRVHGLARHFLHTAHPTLVFPGLPIKVIPFPLAEAQAAVFSRLWTNRLPLPSREVLQGWEREDEEGKGLEGDKVPGEGKSFHVFPKGGDARYINALHDWAATAAPGGSKGKGKEPPFWGDRELWQRSIYAQAKMRFEKTGRGARTLEELGFRYEQPGRESGDSQPGVGVRADFAG